MGKDYQIMIFGRGGQGAKTCAQLIAEAATIANKQVQAFPEYGPERRGAPVRSFVRISDKKIRKHYPILHPNIILVLDDTLFEVMENIANYDCKYIINSSKDKNYFKKIINNNNNEINTIDGSKIALKNIKINNSNVVLIGSLIKLEKIIPLEFAEKTIQHTFNKKNKPKLIKPNITCLKEGYNYF